MFDEKRHSLKQIDWETERAEVSFGQMFEDLNLTTLMWKVYDAAVGLEQWRALPNPDVLLLTFEGGRPALQRIWEG